MINLRHLRVAWDSLADKANRLDPHDQHDWHSLLLGLMMGMYPETDPAIARDLAITLYYNDDDWTTEALMQRDIDAKRRANELD